MQKDWKKLMRSGNNYSKGRLLFYTVVLQIACLLLICMTACSSAPDAGPFSGPEQSTENTTADVVPDSAEETHAPESNTDHAEENAAQAASATEPDQETTEQDTERTDEEDGMKNLIMEINGTEIPVVWEDNESIAALTELAAKAPIMVQMSMYGGFEQVGPLGTSLPRNDQQTTTSAGDIVLYSGNQIVVFYGSNSWAYTRLGHVELSAAEMTDLLGYGDVTIALSVEY